LSLVCVTVGQCAATDPRRTFDALIGLDPVAVLAGPGPLPPVRDVTGDWGRVGAVRTLTVAGGGAVTARMTELDAPREFAYDVTGLPGLAGRLVTGARGCFELHPTPHGGTEITWTLAFRPRPGRALAVTLVVVPRWRRYLRRALARAVHQIHERSVGPVRR
jgi:hypothetical protein